MLFNEIVFLILGMIKESTQNILERVFPQLKNQNLCMSQRAFSKARQKQSGRRLRNCSTQA